MTSDMVMVSSIQPVVRTTAENGSKIKCTEKVGVVDR
jgi:hypothetical protein